MKPTYDFFKKATGSYLLNLREKCVKNSLDLVVLKALYERPRYGYDIIGYVYNTFDVMLSPGTVYPLLEAMERYGILESELASKRRIYSLTGKGREFFKVITYEYLKIHDKLEIKLLDK